MKRRETQKVPSQTDICQLPFGRSEIVYKLKKGGRNPPRPTLEPVANDLSPAFVSEHERMRAVPEDFRCT